MATPHVLAIAVAFVAISCAKQSAPTAGPEISPDTHLDTNDDDYRDPLADLDGPTSIAGPPAGFRGCQEQVEPTLMRVTVVSHGPGEARSFDGCDAIMTPHRFEVESSVDAALERGSTITIWEVGGEIRHPDGTARITTTTRTCGHLPKAGERKEICIQRSGTDFVAACCVHEGSKTIIQAH